MSKEMYRSVIDPVTRRKWIICMENNHVDDPFVRHPAYANNVDPFSTLSREDAKNLKRAIEQAFKIENYFWYLEWYTKEDATLVEEIYLKDLTDDMVKIWYQLPECEDPCGRFRVENDAMADCIKDFSGYRVAGSKGTIPVPYEINLQRYEYWLHGHE